jgi:hypothetical protein
VDILDADHGVAGWRWRGEPDRIATIDHDRDSPEYRQTA